MFYLYHQLTYLSLLGEQHQYLTNIVSNLHDALGNHYRRLVELELAIARSHETMMTRKEKKYLQWSRSITKKTIRDVERRQIYLREHIRQCEVLMHSCAHTVGRNTTGWRTEHPPLAPDPWIPLSAMPRVPQTIEPDYVGQQPRYWNLLMLRERGGSWASVPSADSGFYEPSIFAQALPSGYDNSECPAVVPILTIRPKQGSFQSENDSVADLGTSTSTGAELRSPRRRYSENAIQIIESRFATLKTHKRIRSVEQIPMFDQGVWE